MNTQERNALLTAKSDLDRIQGTLSACMDAIPLWDRMLSLSRNDVQSASNWLERILEQSTETAETGPVRQSVTYRGPDSAA